MRPVALAFAVLQPCSPLLFQAQGPAPRLQPGDAYVSPCPTPAFVVAAALAPPVTCTPADAAVTGGVGHASVQDAVNAAADGDVVFVCPGTHTGTVFVAGRALQLAAVDESAAIDGAGDRALDVSGSSLTVSGLTLTGIADEGGAVRLLDSDLHLDGAVVRDSDAAQNGGGVSALRSTVVIDGTDFLDNDAGYGGGALSLSESCAEVRDSSFLGNEAGYEGGAVTSWSEGPGLGLGVWGSTFAGNTAGYEGGAIDLGTRADALLGLTESIFSDNDAGYAGGAVVAGGYGTVELLATGSTFARNHAGHEGGGIASGNHGFTFVTVVDSDFTDNAADHAGGGIGHNSGSEDAVVVSGGTFRGNDAPSGTAVSVAGWEPLSLTIEGATFDGNPSTTAPDAAWVALEDGFLQGVAVDFVGAGNHVASECGTFSFGLGASFTCDAGKWSTP